MEQAKSATSNPPSSPIFQRNQAESPLLRLPGEIRNIIYGYAIGGHILQVKDGEIELVPSRVTVRLVEKTEDYDPYLPMGMDGIDASWIFRHNVFHFLNLTAILIAVPLLSPEQKLAISEISIRRLVRCERTTVLGSRAEIFTYHVFGLPGFKMPHIRRLLPNIKRVFLNPQFEEQELVSPIVCGIEGVINVFRLGDKRDKGLQLVEVDILDPTADENMAPKVQF
ncbi:hypothetical protein K491DRAFT_722464 [Lophiostoma macrostomum CBS 122681]|uniref:Uncharacterized protein n=1 Tax=Lophiostoma macrostomum CBS 122681 TaxID=1314788 RepID=A0A6A6SPP4_9PLEO|nr:hypothetical protein K491DRAFT_722464 [Lophiostoma macrostomum CBS 122681]